MSLSQLYVQYINKDKEEKDRDPKRLFLSDIGKCPREVAYRLLQTKKDPTTEQQDINRDIMFDLAERLESNLTEAINWRGMLIASQLDAPIEDVDGRVNWGGRLDIAADYWGRRIIEVKSLYPGAFNYDLAVRYISHHHQARAYDHYFRDLLDLDADPLIAYFDRGGQNTPQEIDVHVSWEETSEEMDKLEMVRDMSPTLPDKLGKVLNLRSYGKNIVLEADGRCKKPYCKYTDTCKQDMSTSVVATRDNTDSPWTRKKAAAKCPEMLDEFITGLAQEALEVA